MCSKQPKTVLSCPREWIAQRSGAILLSLRKTWTIGDVALSDRTGSKSKCKNRIAHLISLKTKSGSLRIESSGFRTFGFGGPVGLILVKFSSNGSEERRVVRVFSNS